MHREYLVKEAAVMLVDAWVNAYGHKHSRRVLSNIRNRVKNMTVVTVSEYDAKGVDIDYDAAVVTGKRPTLELHPGPYRNWGLLIAHEMAHIIVEVCAGRRIGHCAIFHRFLQQVFEAAIDLDPYWEVVQMLESNTTRKARVG